MSRKSRRRREAAKKVVKQGTPTPQGDAPIRPKSGPGQVFKDELIDMQSGYAKRFRNIGYSPLVLAFYRGHLVTTYPPGFAESLIVAADERLDAGEQFERTWFVMHRSGSRDSTVMGISGYTGLFWTEAKQLASDRIADIRHTLSRNDFAILQAFCGEMHPAPVALARAGVPFNPKQPWPRICEALDGLVYMQRGFIKPQRIASRATAASVSRVSERASPEVC